VPDEARRYQLVAAVPGSTTSYQDTDVVRGGEYYYYLLAVGSNGIKSSRYYTQTYDAAFLRRPPPRVKNPSLSIEEGLKQSRIVPNPYHLGADPGLHVGGDVRDKIAFYDIPGESRIAIYTELGELVRTLEHTDGSGDEFWDLTTSSRQLVASGIYIAVITDLEDGQDLIRKFVIIR
jgi:hypothetical protein